MLQDGKTRLGFNAVRHFFGGLFGRYEVGIIPTVEPETIEFAVAWPSAPAATPVTWPQPDPAATAVTWPQLADDEVEWR